MQIRSININLWISMILIELNKSTKSLFSNDNPRFFKSKLRFSLPIVINKNLKEKSPKKLVAKIFKYAVNIVSDCMNPVR